MSRVMGLDTSNYTTSAAWFDGSAGRNVGRLLEVPAGGLGLRQSEALFQHVKALPGIVETLLKGDMAPILALGASTQPREVEGSYMPCFLAGESQGRVLAQTLGVPFYPCSHQQGHLAAAAWSADCLELLDMPHLAWHLSGGTTELLYVEPDGAMVRARQIGGTRDLAAGQLIDRTGKRLGLPFPAGKAVDALSLEGEGERFYPVKVQALHFSLSGLENQVEALVQEGENAPNICRFALGSVISAVERATEQALAAYPGLPVLYAGGVAGSQLLRTRAEGSHRAHFAPPEYSSDNAMGAAILAHRRLQRERGHG